MIGVVGAEDRKVLLCRFFHEQQPQGARAVQRAQDGLFESLSTRLFSGPFLSVSLSAPACCSAPDSLWAFLHSGLLAPGTGFRQSPHTKQLCSGARLGPIGQLYQELVVPGQAAKQIRIMQPVPGKQMNKKYAVWRLSPSLLANPQTLPAFVGRQVHTCTASQNMNVMQPAGKTN